MSVTHKRFQVGDKVHHQDYGEGMVVELRPRTFFDVLEVAFADGVRRLNSNHPKITEASSAGATAPETGRGKPAARATTGTTGKKRRASKGSRARTTPMAGPPSGDPRRRIPRNTPAHSEPEGGDTPETDGVTARQDHTPHATPPDAHGNGRPHGPDAPAPSNRAVPRGDSRGTTDPSNGSEASMEGGEPVADDPFRFADAQLLRLDRSSLEPFRQLKRPTKKDGRLLAQHLRAEKLILSRRFKNLLALSSVRDLEQYDFQIQAALRVLRQMHGRAILADEVGLGKTIEAGLILKEYMLRGLVKRALVLTPVSLMTQWREELRHKFDLPFELRSRGQSWNEHPMFIASLDTAKTERNRDEIEAAGFDILVVDEAHRLRNHLTQGWKFVDALSLKYLLLLTATPVQNDLRELHNLVTLLKPGLLGTYREFRQKYVTRGDKRLPKDPSGLAAELGQVMIRTSRSATALRFPRREVHIQTFEMTPPERAFYDGVSEFVRDLVDDSDTKDTPRWHLLLQLLQKEMGSSAVTARKTLERTEHLFRGTEHQSRFRTLIDLGRSVDRQAKVVGLIDLLEGTAGPDGVAPGRVIGSEKVLVFTQFRRTLDYLAAQLRQVGIEPAVFHGSLTPAQKDQAIESFRQETQVLLSTEAGGEGRNLQFCRNLVNFDLPWNPMRIEQRIGRVHRLGQTRDTIIYNFTTRDTVEDYVLAILHRKIQMFELVVGEIDMVLGQWSDRDSFEQEIFRIWSENRTQKERDKAFDELADDLLLARKRHERVQEYDDLIFDRLALPTARLRTEGL